MIKFLKNLYYKQSLTTQITLLIILVFITFFVIQFFLNTTFFPNFYEQRQIDAFSERNREYINNMSDVTNDDYYSIMFTFAQNNNVVTVMLDESFNLIPSTPPQLSVNVRDTLSSFSYNAIIANYRVFRRNENINGVIRQFDDDYWIFTTLNVNQTNVYSSPCNDPSCRNINGQVISQEVPNNINHAFKNDEIIQFELSKLSPSFVAPYRFEDGFRYDSSFGPRNTIVYVNPVGDNYVLSVFSLENTSTIVAILANYQNLVYLSAVILILLYSFRIGSVASKPIKRVEHVASEIANLNFDIEATEFKSKEAISLTKSINSLSKNLREALETLNKNNHELMELYKNQSQQVDLKKQLVSSISHELKTPLMIIQVTIQGIIDGVIPTEDISEEFETALEEINRSTLLIQDLLDVYRLDSKEVPLLIQEFNFSKMVASLHKEFKLVISQENFHYKESIEDNISISADPKLLKRVLSNFMTNALKYTPFGETIEVNLTQDKQGITFEIINYGTHINESILNDIWAPFYRGPTDQIERSGSTGSGIGLYLVSEILKAHKFDFGINNIDNGIRAYIQIKNDHLI
jgi:signal transduction histidine kinase